MDTETALAELGVRYNTIFAEERIALEEDGYLVLPDILSTEEARQFRIRLDELAQEEGERAGLEVHQEAGTDRLADLVNKDPRFDVCFTHPRVLGAVSWVLRLGFKLSSLNSRAALPGEGLQGLHADWHEAVEPNDYYVCNSVWLLDDFTEQNGATRVVPGSHLCGKLPKEDMVDPREPHPGEVLLLAPAGTVVVFNAHVWHGGTRNGTDKSRHALHSYFCRRDQPQQLDQRRCIRPETYARLSPAARYILDV